MNKVSSTTIPVANLLIELGTEELPPTALNNLSNAFTQGIIDGLQAARLGFDTNSIQSFATPRRLAVRIDQLQLKQEDQAIEKLGPNVAAAYDKEGNPSKAAIGFAKSNGVEFEQLEKVETDKGERLCFKSIQTGEDTDKLLEGIINQSLKNLPIPKRMRWGSSRAEFVRPAHWLVTMLDDKVVDAEVLGLKAGNITFGHRFHAPSAITIPHSDKYEELLSNEGQVVTSFDKRKQTIVDQVESIARTLNGSAVIEEDLLDEVTALVEKPVALAGKFDDEFLAVPQEALISSMSEHQKYFHVVDENQQLLPHFITVSNIESKDPDVVIAGNERVIRPRLADAAFFFETDKKLSLAELRNRLQTVVFQKDLGTVFDKTERIATLAVQIAGLIGGDKNKAQQAGELCKADLCSDMVLEFDKMQGIAGTYYAKSEGMSDEVANAIQDHYLPKFSGDKTPSDPVACAVALADRLDTITGIFGIGQEPTGSKDPFALRRASIGLLQIILQNNLSLNLNTLIEKACSQHKIIVSSNNTDTTLERVYNYIFDRFAAYYQEQGISTETFNAVRCINVEDALDFDTRIQAVAEFVKQPESESLAAANKRVSNILEKSDNSSKTLTFDASLLAESAEKDLANNIENIEKEVNALFESNNYKEGLLKLTSLKTPVDTFFDKVMVNAEDPAIRNNRLALLTRLRNLFLHVADISLLVPARK